jgi:hypothetical protein
MVTDEQCAVARAPGTCENRQTHGRWSAPGMYHPIPHRLHVKRVSLAEAKRQNNGGAVAFNGVLGVDSQDILNAPHIDFGTFQLFPDQNNYGATGVENQDPSVDFNTMLAQTIAFITSQVQSSLA